MKTLFTHIIHFGFDENLSAHDKRRIKTINLLNLFIALSLLIGFSNYFILKTEFKVWPSLVFMSAAFLSLYFSKLNKTTAAFILFTINVNAAIFFTCKIYPSETAPYVFYFPVIVSIVLLNNPAVIDRFAIFHFALCIVFFVGNLLVDVPQWHIQNLTADQITRLWHLNLIISAFITGAISLLLTRIISNQNKEIIIQNNDLILAKEAINGSLKEKEVLLAELHHRVKNNLAIISGLLNLQEDASSNEEVRQIISDSKTRIMSMALVHQMLYENSELKSIDIGKYASELIHKLFDSYDLNQHVRLIEDYDKIILPVNKSIPLGLILNEIVTNSIKYVFKKQPQQNGQLAISIKQLNQQINITVHDSGMGFPKDFSHGPENRSLGIYLIKTLTDQIDGHVQFSNDKGAKICLTFLPN